jgi:hypothetical protein
LGINSFKHSENIVRRQLNFYIQNERLGNVTPRRPRLKSLL